MLTGNVTKADIIEVLTSIRQETPEPEGHGVSKRGGRGRACIQNARCSSCSLPRTTYLGTTEDPGIHCVRQSPSEYLSDRPSHHRH